jgi:hypothetical protein
MRERRRTRGSAGRALSGKHRGEGAGAVGAYGANAHVRPPLVSSPRWALAHRTRWHRSCLGAAVGTARRTSRRLIDLTRLQPDRVLAALREPAVLVNIVSRLLIVLFTIDALVNAGDDRFAGKALGPRNVGIMLGFSMLFPLVYLVAKRWRSYPWWYDNLYLSIFWLDMAGNSLNLYNSVEWWDHIPHFHGPGALSAVLMGVFGLPGLAAAGLATILHVTLECWEYYGDVLMGTHNVRGIADSINDLAYGLAGMLAYTMLFGRFAFTRRRRAKPDKR